jgi:hypothetical protein
MRILLGVICCKEMEPETFSINDLPRLNITSQNGFLKLWSLNERLDVDVSSYDILTKSRRLLEAKQTNVDTFFQWYNNEYKKNWEK